MGLCRNCLHQQGTGLGDSEVFFSSVFTSKFFLVLLLSRIQSSSCKYDLITAKCLCCIQVQLQTFQKVWNKLHNSLEIAGFVNQELLFKKDYSDVPFSPCISNRPRDKQPNCFCLQIPEGIVVCVRGNLCKDVVSLHVLLGFAIKVD